MIGSEQFSPESYLCRDLNLKRHITILILFLTSTGAFAQEVSQKTFYDQEEKIVKEIFILKKRGSSILHGPYTAYFQNGNIKTSGHYYENTANGAWEFFYENGALRIRGNINSGVNEGLWEYFFDNSEMNMEGPMVGGKKSGTWKTYYRSGATKSEGEYYYGKKTAKWNYYYANGSLQAISILENGNGQHEEYFPAGGVKMKGMKVGGKKSGFWTYYNEGGTKKGEGGFINDLKQGKWVYYNEEGIRVSEGVYDKDQQSGLWVDYFENGSVSSRGNFEAGQKEGFWNLFYDDGTSRGEGTFMNGTGEYREYYRTGAIKTKGHLVNGKNDGYWEYYYENSELEGICEFDDGVGEYSGFYSNGTRKMKGTIRNDVRIGIWELYKEDGELAGYYKPYYENGNSELWLARESEEQKELKRTQTRKVGSYKYKKKKFSYFDSKINEYRSIIIGYNPLAPLVNSFPLGLEYYHQERLGHELLFNLIRDPFFRNHSTLSEGTEYKKGLEIAVRQKFYNKMKKFGAPYFGHEVRYSTVFHSVKVPDQIVPSNVVELTKNEQKYEYSIFVGTRYFKAQQEGGFTVDTYIGIGIGYRVYYQNYTDTEDNKDYFFDLPTSNISIPIRFGINIGYGIPVR